MSEAHPSIEFDYERALEVARRLHELAEEWEVAFARWRASIDSALARWEGPHHDAVADAVRRDAATSEEIGHALRAEAEAWATAWADALADQRLLARAGTAAGPEADPAPGPVDVPSAPHYHPTAPAPVESWR